MNDAGDERARHALARGTGLLPASSDAITVQELLQGAGIDCWTGWDYIAGIPDVTTRWDMVRRNPLVLGGVVLNDGGQLKEAQDTVHKAGILAASIIPVIASQSLGGDAPMGLTSGPMSLAHFVVPPHPAFFDPEAAEVELDVVTVRHQDNVAAIDAIAAGLARDRELAERLRQWRADFPPGELARLATTTEQAYTAVLAAQRNDAANEEAAAALRGEQLAAQNRMPDLRAAVTALEQRHRRLDELSRLERTVPGLERERASATAEAEVQDKLAGEANTTLGELRNAVEGHRALASQHSASAQRARLDLADVRAGGEVTEEEQLSSEPLSALRDRFVQAGKAYAQVEVGADLREELAAAKAHLADAESDILKHPGDIRRRAEALLNSVNGVDVESRTTSRELAQRRHKEVSERRVDAQQALADRNADLKHVHKPRVERLLPEEPTGIAHAQELVHVAQTGAIELEARLENLTRDRIGLETELAELNKSLNGFELLRTSLNTSTPSDQVIPEEPYGQDIETANQAYREIMSAVNEHRKIIDRAVGDVVRVADHVAGCASASRYDKLAIPVREQVAATLRSDLPKHAAAWLEDLKPRLLSVVGDLHAIERHRGSLVVRLQGLVDQALRTLTRAQRMSKLPPSLGDWSGEEFLRIKFTALEGEALKHVIGNAIDEAAAGEDDTGKTVPRDGLSLLLRGVAAAAPQGFRADMLKPDSVLRNERQPVAGVREVFSGGQHLTAAIILYCTMAALRANDRGRVANRHSGVLFLDNPIGRASAGYLLDLQRGVAEALGVQLIYTTGLFDAEALAGFPVLIRLRNDADIRANRKYLTVEPSVHSHWASLAEPDETSLLSATRMVIRGRQESDRAPGN